MNAALSGLPSFEVIAAALRRTTERLARELHQPGEQAPAWNDFEWRIARAVATMQGITPLLARKLRWQGPDDWQAFLGEQRDLSRQRDARIADLIARTDDALRAHGVRAVALKGAALRPLALYLPGERPMGDIDLLVRREKLGRTAIALQDLDYVRAFASRRHVVYEPRDKAPVVGYGEHPDNALKIEIHQAISEPLPVRHVDITAGLLEPGAPGIAGYPDHAELMRHLLLHAAGNIRAHALRQIQLHDIASLAARLPDSAWRRLLSTPQSGGGSWWMFPPLALTERYYPGSVGGTLDGSLAAFAERCPPLLRQAARRTTLTAVSWSNLRIAAFPGICWSRSPRDALRFARSRLAPDRQARAELNLALEAQPALAQARWYDESHLIRILRWVFSRPPRAQTLISLRAALAGAGGRLDE